MKVKKNLQELIKELKQSDKFGEQITYWHTLEEKEAQVADMPIGLDSHLMSALEKEEYPVCIPISAQVTMPLWLISPLLLLHQQRRERPYVTICRYCRLSLIIHKQGPYIYFLQKHLLRIRKWKSMN